MNNDQLYHFLVNKDTRKVLQIEYPSDIDEFNKILGTSEGKGSLLKNLGIILNFGAKTFTNPKPKVFEPEKVLGEIETTITDFAQAVEFNQESTPELRL